MFKKKIYSKLYTIIAGVEVNKMILKSYPRGTIFTEPKVTIIAIVTVHVTMHVFSCTRVQLPEKHYLPRIKL